MITSTAGYLTAYWRSGGREEGGERGERREEGGRKEVGGGREGWKRESD